MLMTIAKRGRSIKILENIIGQPLKLLLFFHFHNCAGADFVGAVNDDVFADFKTFFHNHKAAAFTAEYHIAAGYFVIFVQYINISGFAAEVNEVNTKLVVNSDNGEVSLALSIWGETTTKSQERVSVKILRPDVDEANPDLSLFEKYAYIDQTKSDASGNYSFDIEFNEDSGEYTIIVIDSKEHYIVSFGFLPCSAMRVYYA